MRWRRSPRQLQRRFFCYPCAVRLCWRFFPNFAIFALVSDHLRNFCFYSWASLLVLPSLLRLLILLSLSPLVTSLGGQGCSPPSLVVPVVFALGEFISVAAVLCLLLPPPAGVMSALAEPPWCVCSACLGTPEVFTLGVMQLAALLGFPCWLTQVDCSTPAVMVSLGVGDLSCHSCTVSPLFSCWGGFCFAPCVRVLQLRCYLLGLQVGFPCCLFLTLGECTSGYGVYRVCGLRRRFRLPFVVLHPLPVSVGPSPFFWSWDGFWSRVGGSSCDSWFWSLLMLGHTFLTPSPLPLLPSLAVGWSWRLVFLVFCLGSVLLASRVGC